MIVLSNTRSLIIQQYTNSADQHPPSIFPHLAFPHLAFQPRSSRLSTVSVVCSRPDAFLSGSSSFLAGLRFSTSVSTFFHSLSSFPLSISVVFAVPPLRVSLVRRFVFPYRSDRLFLDMFVLSSSVTSVFCSPPTTIIVLIPVALISCTRSTESDATFSRTIRRL